MIWSHDSNLRDAPIVAGQGTTRVFPGIAGKNIAVVWFYGTMSGASTLQFLSIDGAGNTQPITGAMPIANAGDGFDPTRYDGGLFTTKQAGDGIAVIIPDAVNFAGVGQFFYF